MSAEITVPAPNAEALAKKTLKRGAKARKTQRDSKYAIYKAAILAPGALNSADVKEFLVLLLDNML